MSTTADPGFKLSEKFKDITLLAVIVIVPLLVIVVAIIIYRLCRQKEREGHNTTELVSDLNYKILMSDLNDKMQYVLSKSSLCLDSYKVLNKVKPPENGELENSYCIVTFNDANVDEIIPIIQDCFVGKVRFKDLDMNQLKIIKREDVLELPKSKVHLVCITKNDKNVILEPPNSDLGDLRLLTVKACQKINAEVFVIYYGDEDSRTLMPKLLYNPQIACVTEHPELKELERQDKVITCADKLTITQRERLAEFIV